jgi:hypothetical protein
MFVEKRLDFPLADINAASTLAGALSSVSHLICHFNTAFCLQCIHDLDARRRRRGDAMTHRPQRRQGAAPALVEERQDMAALQLEAYDYIPLRVAGGPEQAVATSKASSCPTAYDQPLDEALR